jgi:AcrR family transcriptional regulator
MKSLSKPAAETPSGRRPSDLREALVAGATAILDQEGEAGLNLRRLAAGIGVTQPALYRHFDSKDALLDEIVLRGIVALARRARDAEREAEDAYDVLARYGGGYVRHAAVNPGWFRLFFGRGLADRSARGGEATRTLDELRDRLLRALACIVPPNDAAFGHTFRAYWGLLHGLASLVADRVFQLVKDDEARIRAAEAAVAEMLALLRARWGPARPLGSLPENVAFDLTRGLDATGG